MHLSLLQPHNIITTWKEARRAREVTFNLIHASPISYLSVGGLILETVENPQAGRDHPLFDNWRSKEKQAIDVPNLCQPKHFRRVLSVKVR